MNMSVIIEDFDNNIKYKESLKEFLHPTFENAAIHQDKKIGKHLKICTQALGMKPDRKENKDCEEVTNKKKKK